MEEKKIYYVSLNPKEINEIPTLTEPQFKIEATTEEYHRLHMYLTRCIEYEESEPSNLLTPLNNPEDEGMGEKYNEDLNTIYNIIYDLGTKETKAEILKM